MYFIKLLIKQILYTKPMHLWLHKLSKYFIGTCLSNINLDLANPYQKRVLISYVNPILRANKYHANILHAYQMINTFIKLNYCIDICDYNDNLAYDIFKKYKYDLIIGFGPVYELFVLLQADAKSVLFLTENYPQVVSGKYAERVHYFKKRHPETCYRYAVERMSYYSKSMVDISSSIIMMSSQYNASGVDLNRKPLFLVNVNSIINPAYVFDTKRISQRKHSFVCFGCNGIIHKGIDVLIDVFKELPSINLHIYGLGKNEDKLFYKLNPTPNIYLHDPVDVCSEEYLNEVVGNCLFVILNSCSEGMASGVATCMSHGLIPIVSRESGYDPAPCIIILKDFTVEAVKEAIMEVETYSDTQLSALSEDAYKYARENFNLEVFSSQFSKAIESFV